MPKFWLIARYEYERHVLKRSFLLGTLSVPLVMVIAVVASALVRALAGAPAEGSGGLPGGPTAGQLLPALSGFALLILILLSAGYLMGAVADEKANRTIEILVTSLSPRTLMAAKLLAVLAITLTQLVVWVVGVGLLGLVGRSALGLAWLQDVRVDPATAWSVLAVLLPSYVLVAALLAAAGAILAGGHSARHVTTLLVTIYMAVAMLATSMLRNPDHPLMVALSLLPLAAPVVLPLRAAFTHLPSWQVGASAAIQVVCAAGAVWLAGRALRLGMLRHGRRLRWRELVGRPVQGAPFQPGPGMLRQGIRPVAGTESAERRRGKTWLVLRYELLTTVTRPMYVLTCLGVPLLVLVQLGMMIYSRGPAEESAQVPLSADPESVARLVSLLVMLLLYGMILMASGLMLRSVSEEKKNRVMELLLLSVSPRQMLAGKTVALGAAGLIQAAVWAVMGWLFFLLGGEGLQAPIGITLSPALLAWFLAFALLGYAVYASLYAGAGALLPDWRKSRQAALLIALPAFIGFEIGLLTGDSPHGPLALVASMFPLTAPFVMIKRLVVGGVPGWQPPAAAALMALSLPLIVRAVARMFHAQNLLSGQPFSVKRYFRALLGLS